MINIAVCEDEKNMSERIRKAAYEFFNSYNIDIVTKQFKNGVELLNSKINFDIIFLDIQKPDLNGIETAKSLRKSGYNGAIIFITVMKDAVFDSFEVNPFAYLVKPLDHREINKVMKRFLEALKRSENSKLLIKKKNEIIVVNLDDIVFFEVINRKVYIKLRSRNSIEYYDKIGKLEKKLDYRFFKPHRSFLINLKYLKRFDSRTATMETGDEIPISRLRIKEFEHGVLNYLGNKNY